MCSIWHICFAEKILHDSQKEHTREFEGCGRMSMMVLSCIKKNK